MSTLVSYESSSEEDVPAPQKVQSKFESLAKISTIVSADEKSISTHADASQVDKEVSEQYGPLVGPVMHPDNSALQGGEDELTQELPSERETLRYLTQATHPMTSIPPSPSNSPDPTASARIKRFLELKANGVHFNEDLAGKTTFRNPGLFPALLARVGVELDEQHDTSISRELWDPTSFPTWTYKDELLKSQQRLREAEEAQRKSLSATGRRSIGFTSAVKMGESNTVSSLEAQNKYRKP